MPAFASPGRKSACRSRSAGLKRGLVTETLITVPQLIAMAIAGLAGIIRGINGFGGAMVMTPPLALLLGPQLAVPVVLLLEAFAGAPMMRDAARKATWRRLAPIALAACVTVPWAAICSSMPTRTCCAGPSPRCDSNPQNYRSPESPRESARRANSRAPAPRWR